MSSPAVFWRVLQEVERGLKEDLRFEAADDGDPQVIVPEAIVIRKFPLATDGLPARTNEMMPGWLICPGRRVIRDPSRGTNVDDEPSYTVLCQLLAVDYERPERNLPTYLKWLEQVGRYLNHHFAGLNFTGDFGCVHDSFATVTMTADPKEWTLHQNWVGGVEMQAIAWESRGVT
jgi:hypothetical protein